MITLRPYQREAINATYNAFRAGVSAPLVVMPTGSGKAPTLCTFIREALEQWPDQRMVMLVHVRELVEQNLRTMLRIWPDAPVSVYSAGLRCRDLSGRVVFGSIQSLYKRAYDLQKVDLLISDESHLIPASGDGMYRKLLDDLAKINGGQVPMVGFTATPFRLSTGSLVEGDGRVFDRVVHEVGLLELIDGGYLCPPITRATDTKIDTRGVGTRGGEFIAAALQRATDKTEITKTACAEIVKAGADRRSWLVFSTGVEHARHIRDELRSLGVSCEMVSGETPLSERDRMIRAHKTGQLRALVNDSVLTTGYDNPIVDLLAVLRPTQSAGLWVQMVGRGTRTAPGKTDCLVLDFGGNAHRHGPLDQITGRFKNGSGVPPMKDCPECNAIILAGLLACPHCGFEFDITRERKQHEAVATAAPLLSADMSDWLPVKAVTYHRHTKPGSPDSLRVDYHCGLARYSEWVCVEHGGYAAAKAARWWHQRHDEEVPDTVSCALILAPDLDRPHAIRIRRDGQYWRVVQVRFS